MRKVNDAIPFTCPKIDDVIYRAQKAVDILEEEIVFLRADTEIDTSELQNAVEQLGDIEWLMDEIRGDNEGLREYANEWGYDADELEAKVEELHDTLARKDERILALEERVFDAEKEVADAQHYYQPVWSNG